MRTRTSMFGPSSVWFPLLCSLLLHTTRLTASPPPSSPLPDLYEDFKSPVPAAMGFIQQLAAQRKKFALIPILSFCNDILLK